MTESVVPGQLVISRAGRDRGRAYLVYGLVDERHVLVIDGDRRTRARPKLKNLRHLKVLEAVHPLVVRAKSSRGHQGATDQEVKQALTALLAELDKDALTRNG